MKRFLIAITLACVLSGTALAGDMPGVGQSPAPGSTQGPSAPAPGEMPTMGEIQGVGLPALLMLIDLAF